MHNEEAVPSDSQGRGPGPGRVRSADLADRSGRCGGRDASGQSDLGDLHRHRGRDLTHAGTRTEGWPVRPGPASSRPRSKRQGTGSQVMESMIHQPALIAALTLALAAAVSDARTRRIPNALVAAGASAGLILNSWTGGGEGLTRSLLGLVAGFCVYLPFFLLRGMGGGDVKLMGALGA